MSTAQRHRQLVRPAQRAACQQAQGLAVGLMQAVGAADVAAARPGYVLQLTKYPAPLVTQKHCVANVSEGMASPIVRHLSRPFGCQVAGHLPDARTIILP